jgi:hypothetical protein
MDKGSSRRLGLFRIILADRELRAPALLLVLDAAVRGLLTTGPDGEVVFSFACDRRIEPVGGMMVFRDLEDALSWLTPRLGAHACPDAGASRDWHRSGLERDARVAEAQARERFLDSASRFCSTLDETDIPTNGALRTMYGAWRKWCDVIETQRGITARSSGDR